MSSKIKSVKKKNLRSNESLGPDDCTPAEFHEALKEELIWMILKLFQKKKRRGENSFKFFPKPLLLNAKWDKDTTHTHTHTKARDKHPWLTWMWITQQNTTKLNLSGYYKFIHHDQMQFIPGITGCSPYINQNLWHISSLTKWNTHTQNHMSISSDAERTFDKIQHTFMTKPLT